MNTDLFSLKGKKVVLTGAAGFFGRYFAEALLLAGCDEIFLIDINEDRLRNLYNELSKRFNDRSVEMYVVDQKNFDSAGKTFEEILRKAHIDVLINNAFDFSKNTGFNSPSGRIENAHYDQLKAAFDSGVYWAIQTTQVFGIPMKRKGRGSIINICSMYSTIVPNQELYFGTDKFNPPGYSMAKAGLLQFTRYSASFLGPEVRVNALSPGAVPNTEIETYNAVNEKDPVLERLNDKTILKRMGHPTDLIGGLIYFASEASSYVTGQNLIIDGGITVT